MKLKSTLHFLLILVLFVNAVPAFALAPASSPNRTFPFKTLQSYFTLPEETAKRLNAVLPSRPYVILDFETTGRDFDEDTFIEVAALRFEGTKLVGAFHTLVNPGNALIEKMKTDHETNSIHKISWKSLLDKPDVSTVVRKLAVFIAGADIVGHNVKYFDWKFFRRASDKSEFPFAIKYASIHDTVTLAKKHLSREQVDRYTLESLSHYINKRRGKPLPISPNHFAMNDAAANAFLFWYLRGLEAQRIEALNTALSAKGKKEQAQKRDDFVSGIRPLFTFLEHDKVSLGNKIEVDTAVVITEAKLDDVTARRLYRGHQEGRIQKIVIFAEMPNFVIADTFAFLAKEKSFDAESLEKMAADTIVLPRPNGAIKEQMAEIYQTLQNRKLPHQQIAFMASPITQRRMVAWLMQLTKDQGIKIISSPNGKINLSELVRTKKGREKLLNELLAALRELEKIKRYKEDEENPLTNVFVLGNANQAYNFIVDALRFRKPKEPSSTESSI